MNNIINLAVIAQKAKLLNKLSHVHAIAKANLDIGLDTFNAVEARLKLLGLYRDFHNASYLIGFVTYLESYISDSIREILYCFPQKIKDKSFKVDEISDVASISLLLKEKADSRLNEITYKSFKDIVELCQQDFGLTKDVPVDLVERISEIKSTRDLYAHEGGVVNKIYLRKAGALSRAKSGEKLQVDTEYLLYAIGYLGEFIGIMNNSFVEVYKKYRPVDVFRQMWEMSSLEEVLPFETYFRVYEKHVMPNWIEVNLGAELLELYKFMMYIANFNYGFDVVASLYHWPVGTKERVMIYSWLDNPFYLG